MEKLNEFLAALKERFTNPLLFSFFFSWIIINWPVTVALIWYDNIQQANTNTQSIYQFILLNTDEYKSFWLPLLLAIIYTLLNPVIKNLIRAFYTWTTKWGDNWNIKISDGAQIEMDKYLNLKDSLDKRRKVLEQLIKSESKNIEKIEQLTNENSNLSGQINKLKQDSSKKDIFVKQLKDYSIIQGSWKNEYAHISGNSGVENVEIVGDKYQVWDTERYFHKFNIIDFYYDNTNSHIYFVKELVDLEKLKRPINEHYCINWLRIEGKGVLQGKENGFDITYTKRDITKPFDEDAET